MPYIYSCPVDGCGFNAEDPDKDRVVEFARDHNDEKHDAELDRDEIEQSITGSGTP